MIVSTTTDPPDRKPLQRRRMVVALGVGYALLWALLAIDPVDRGDWLLENLLVFVVVPGILLANRRLGFSDVSFALMLAFLALHTVGAHYTYSKVPFGFWLQSTLDLARNPYDRIVHASFGLLLAYPIREALIRQARVKNRWWWYFPVSATIAWSATFEIIEAIVAWIVNPELGAAYLGIQGDEWDAQKDMGCALAGALIAMGITAALERRRPRIG